MNPAALFAFNFLLNALWQIPLVFGAAWLAARLARHNGPQWEHRIWVAALFFELILPFGQLHLKPIAAWLLALVTPAAPSAANGSVRILTGATTVAAPTWNLPSLVILLVLIAWAATILYFTTRLLWKLHKTSTLRRHTHAIEPQEYPALQSVLNTHPTPLELLVSQSVTGPAIIGFLRPALLLPPHFLDRTEASDVEAALAHELTHLRRRDYAKNLLYEFLTLPIAWHPVAWLTRSRIAESREILCDHLAARITLGPHSYARALLRLASQQSTRTPQPIHAIGIFDSQSLERRVMKLTQSQIRSTLTRRLLTFAACAALAVTTGASALALHVSASPNSAHSKAASSKPVHVPARVIAGNRISGEFPKYPPEAKKNHIQGTVVVKAMISKEGKIESAHAISGPKLLREPSVKAIRTWRYRPYLHNGKPVAVETTINVIFSLDNHKPTHTTAILQLPDLRQQMEMAQQAAQQAARLQSLNSAKMQKQLAQAQKQLSEAMAKLNSQKFKEQMAQAQRQAMEAQRKAMEAERKLESGQIQQQLQKAQKSLQKQLEKLKKLQPSGAPTTPNQP